MSEPTVAMSAQNRAWRTLLQGLAFDVAAAVALVLFTAIIPAESWGDFEWTLIGFTVFKSVAVSILSYLMRTVLRDKLPPIDSPTATVVNVSPVQIKVNGAAYADDRDFDDH